MISSQANHQRNDTLNSLPKSSISFVPNEVQKSTDQINDCQLTKKEKCNNELIDSSCEQSHEELSDSELLRLLEESEKMLPAKEPMEISPQHLNSETQFRTSVQSSNTNENSVEKSQDNCMKNEQQKIIGDKITNTEYSVPNASAVGVQETSENDSIEDDTLQESEKSTKGTSSTNDVAQENESSFPLIRPIVSFTEEMVNKHNLFNYSKQ